jgi:hypothetical protein
MGGSDFERDDVHALPYPVDVACVGGIPERGGMALVGLGREEELKSDVCGGWGMVEKGVRLVVGGDGGTQFSCQGLLLLVLVVLLCYCSRLCYFWTLGRRGGGRGARRDNAI